MSTVTGLWIPTSGQAAEVEVERSLTGYGCLVQAPFEPLVLDPFSVCLICEEPHDLEPNPVLTKVVEHFLQRTCVPLLGNGLILGIEDGDEVHIPSYAREMALMVCELEKRKR